VLESDPRLEAEENRALRTLLWVFEREQAVRLLEAG
jgi:ATP-dependent DNA helicase RecG